MQSIFTANVPVLAVSRLWWCNIFRIQEGMVGMDTHEHHLSCDEIEVLVDRLFASQLPHNGLYFICSEERLQKLFEAEGITCFGCKELIRLHVEVRIMKYIR